MDYKYGDVVLFGDTPATYLGRSSGKYDYAGYHLVQFHIHLRGWPYVANTQCVGFTESLINIINTFNHTQNLYWVRARDIRRP